MLYYNCLQKALKELKAIFKPKLRTSKEVLKTREIKELSSSSIAEAQGMEVNLCKEQCQREQRGKVEYTESDS